MPGSNFLIESRWLTGNSTVSLLRGDLLKNKILFSSQCPASLLRGSFIGKMKKKCMDLSALLGLLNNPKSGSCGLSEMRNPLYGGGHEDFSSFQNRSPCG